MCSERTEHSASFHAEKPLQPLAVRDVVLVSCPLQRGIASNGEIVDVLVRSFHSKVKVMASHTGKEDCDGQMWVSLAPCSQQQEIF